MATLASSSSPLVSDLEAAVQSGDWDRALTLVVTNWAELVAPESFASLVAMADALPTSVVADQPVLALGTGGILLIRGHSRRAGEFFDLAVVRDDPGARATALALKAHATWWLTAAEEALGHLDEAAAILDAHGGASLVAVPGFEPLTSGRTGLIVSRARALALVGQVASAATLIGVLDHLADDDPAADSVSAWATKAWIEAMAGDLDGSSRAADQAFQLSGEEWAHTPPVAPAHLARSIIACGRVAPEEAVDQLGQAVEIARQAHAWGLLQVCHAVSAMCGVTMDDFPESGPAGPGLVPLAGRVLGAHRARSRLRAGDREGAAALLDVTQPTELALGAWAEVATAVLGVELTAEVLADLPAPPTPVGRLIRATVDALLTPAGEMRDAHLVVALTLADRLGAPGLLSAAPEGVLARLRDLARPDQVVGLAADGNPPGDSDRHWSTQEQAILERLDGPLTVAQISSELHLSPHTVKWYVARIYRRLGVHNRADAVEAARRRSSNPAL